VDIRRAVPKDIDSVSEIYEMTHDAEEAGLTSTGWMRGVYPTRETAESALSRGDLFVETDANGDVVGAAVINRLQVDVYEGAPWRYPAEDGQVMVLHTLVISPEKRGGGFGRAFVGFYEDYAEAHGSPFLRMDTNARNTSARAFYKALGYSEIAVVPTTFNGIPGVDLVLLEKKL